MNPLTRAFLVQASTDQAQSRDTVITGLLRFLFEARATTPAMAARFEPGACPVEVMREMKRRRLIATQLAHRKGKHCRVHWLTKLGVAVTMAPANEA